MRLDKYIASVGNMTRSEAGNAIRKGRVFVNGSAVRTPDLHVNETLDSIMLDGKKLSYNRFTYIMLNKPKGYVSATDDGNLPTVLDLLPSNIRKGLFPCGRLDRDTVGLMLLTDDGELAHFLLSPVSHVPKSYAFTCLSPLTDNDVTELESGVDIGEKKITKPSRLTLTDPQGGVIEIREGRYHQIKRMFEAVQNKITSLKRLTFGPLTLDGSLSEGDWRYLTEREIEELQKHNRNILENHNDYQ